MPEELKIVIEQEDATVVARYEHQERKNDGYQSEAQLEKSLIEQLCRQGYDYPKIHNEEQLVENLRGELWKWYLQYTRQYKNQSHGAWIAGRVVNLNDKSTRNCMNDF